MQSLWSRFIVQRGKAIAVESDDQTNDPLASGRAINGFCWPFSRTVNVPRIGAPMAISIALSKTATYRPFGLVISANEFQGDIDILFFGERRAHVRSEVRQGGRNEVTWRVLFAFRLRDALYYSDGD